MQEINNSRKKLIATLFGVFVFYKIKPNWQFYFLPHKNKINKLTEIEQYFFKSLILKASINDTINYKKP